MVYWHAVTNSKSRPGLQSVLPDWIQSCACTHCWSVYSGTKCHKALSCLVVKQTSEKDNFWNLAFSACGLLATNTKI